MGRVLNLVTPAGTRGYAYSLAGLRKTYALDGTSSTLTVDGTNHLTAFGAKTYSFDAAENPTRLYDSGGQVVDQHFSRRSSRSDRLR